VNFVDRPEVAAALKDSHPAVMRLVRLMQIGCQSLVYPAAAETKRKAKDELAELATELAQLAQLAALVHDTGHMPFAHAVFKNGLEHKFSHTILDSIKGAIDDLTERRDEIAAFLRLAKWLVNQCLDYARKLLPKHCIFLMQRLWFLYHANVAPPAARTEGCLQFN